MKQKPSLGVSRNEVRRLIADYMASEGCSCCRDIDGHAIAEKALAKLLSVPLYADKSGYNFSKFRSNPS